MATYDPRDIHAPGCRSLGQGTAADCTCGAATGHGYTFTEAWNLQLQCRVQNLERVLGALVGLAELTGPSNLKAYKSLLDEAKTLLHGDPDAQADVERLLAEAAP